MHINLLFQYCTTLKAITETTFRLQGIEECSFVFKCRKLIDRSIRIRRLSSINFPAVSASIATKTTYVDRNVVRAFDRLSANRFP